MPLLSKHPMLLLSLWLALSVMIGIGDYLSGPMILFPIFYLIPIALVSWTHGRRWGVPLAVVMSFFRLGFTFIWPAPWTVGTAMVNTIIRIVVLTVIAVLVDRVATQKRELEKEIQILKGILPICSYCKRIRNQSGEWETLEAYIMDRSEAKFSHSLCPACTRTHYADYLDPRT